MSLVHEGKKSSSVELDHRGRILNVECLMVWFGNWVWFNESVIQYPQYGRNNTAWVSRAWTEFKQRKGKLFNKPNLESLESMYFSVTIDQLNPHVKINCDRDFGDFNHLKVMKTQPYSYSQV